MSGFKLLAIRILDDCNDKFKKVLNKNQIFKFYSNYDFLDKDDNLIDSNSRKEVFKIKENNLLPDNFYSDKLLINVSAVVGKNGCGKSTLIEFLYYAIYCLGTSVKYADEKNNILTLLSNYSEILKDENDKRKSEIKRLKSHLNDLYEAQKNLVSELGDDLGNEHIKANIYSIVEIETKITELNNLIDKYSKIIKSEKKQHDFILDNFHGSIFYELEEEYYELRIDKKDDELEELLNREDSNVEVFDVFSAEDMDLGSLTSKELNKPFFYTIAINYSHYSLNNKVIGNWINTLFHKNDGYKTPIVINPMRSKGDFEIIHENYLAKQRLIINVVSQKLLSSSPIYISDKHIVKQIQFQFKNQKVGKLKLSIENDSLSSIGGRLGITVLLKLIEKRLANGVNKIIKSSQKYKIQVLNYALNKLEKLLLIYDEYDFHNWEDTEMEKVDLLVDRLNLDSSHVMFKLNQAINYLIRNTESVDFSEIVDTEGRITPKQLLDWMGISKVEDVVKFIPPPLFSVDFVLEDATIEKEKRIDISFGSLSSGEQQFIHSSQAVIYHLVNLESIHSSSVERLRYAAVNIAFDEIELYFHPDLQRRFISSLLKSIESLNLGENEFGIKSINIQFLTHSPFILSDIPSQNVLKLKDGKPEKSEINTFGANIHELLADSFFMDSTIGAIAKDKIQSIFEFYQEVRSFKSSEEKNRLKTVYKLRRKGFYQLVKLIGEEVIEGILLNHLSYLDKQFDINYSDDLKETLEYHESELKRIKREIRLKSSDETD